MESILQGCTIRLVEDTSCPNDVIDAIRHVIYAIITSVSSFHGSIPDGLYTDINAITSTLPVSLAPYDLYNNYYPRYTQYYVTGLCRALTFTSAFFDWPFGMIIGGKNPFSMLDYFPERSDLIIFFWYELPSNPDFMFDGNIPSLPLYDEPTSSRENDASSANGTIFSAADGTNHHSTVIATDKIPLAYAWKGFLYHGCIKIGPAIRDSLNFLPGVNGKYISTEFVFHLQVN